MIEFSPNGYRCQCGQYHGTPRRNRVTLSALCAKCRDQLHRVTVEADKELEMVRDATAVLLQFPTSPIQNLFSRFQVPVSRPD
jgi:hypothetical protein